MVNGEWWIDNRTIGKQIAVEMSRKLSLLLFNSREA
jgi:hypothetical protein